MPAIWAAGKIGASELAELFQNLGHPLTYERLVEVMRTYDVDHSGEIEFGEFLRMFQTDLLDLQEVLDYIRLDPAEKSRSPQVCNYMQSSDGDKSHLHFCAHSAGEFSFCCRSLAVVAQHQLTIFGCLRMSSCRQAAAILQAPCRHKQV